jgi:hypothetical protein
LEGRHAVLELTAYEGSAAAADLPEGFYGRKTRFLRL